VNDSYFLSDSPTIPSKIPVIPNSTSILKQLQTQK